MADKKYPTTTLFMLMSLDGKISTGEVAQRDFDKDIPVVPYLKEGLQQYYDLEMKTDLTSFNTGKVMAKIGWNSKKSDIQKIPVTFVLIDNMPHITHQGVLNLLQRSRRVYIVTTNKNHPATKITDPNLNVFIYNKQVNLKDLWKQLKEFGRSRITIQSGGTMNAALIREGLIDRVHIVVLPAIVGGNTTPTLIDGESLKVDADLQKIKTLELSTVKKLKNSYLLLKYIVRETTG